MFPSTTLLRLTPVAAVTASTDRRPRRSEKKTRGFTTTGLGGVKEEPLWRCVEGCGACCKLAKSPAFATPEEIFSDSHDVQHYKSLIGTDGWCIHYDKTTRKCSIYDERPYFCHVELSVFQSLYGTSKKKFNKVACSSCRDTIKAVYGSKSKELDNFNESLKSCSTSYQSLKNCSTN